MSGVGIQIDVISIIAKQEVSFSNTVFKLIALGKAKIVCNFGLSEGNRFNNAKQ